MIFNREKMCNQNNLLSVKWDSLLHLPSPMNAFTFTNRHIHVRCIIYASVDAYVNTYVHTHIIWLLIKNIKLYYIDK